MVAKEAYKIIRATVGPWFRTNGFKVLKESFPVYQTQLGQKFVTVKFRCHTNGWDKHKGSSFCVWFKWDSDPTIDDGPLHLLTRQLTLPEREFIRARQNRIVSSIPAPPPEYVGSMVQSFQKTFKEPQQYIDWFLKDWQIISQPYPPEKPIWFRYRSEDDVRAWALLILNHVKSLCSKLANAA
jgi:hypothetical protein